jgi:undecaprenyl-phosphate 4-deoxy-4-formamido-L-arabinose transferase
MDDDLQHAPADIPRLVARCESLELDVCYARFAELKHAWWKRVGSWLNGKLAEVVIAKPKHLYLSPFKAIRREVVSEVVKYTGAFPYLDGLLLNITHNMGEIDAVHGARFSGPSTYSLSKSVLVFMRVATGFSVWPLRFSALVGSILACTGFALAIFYWVQYVVWEHHIEGWMTIVSLQLLIGGTLLLSIGLVGEYLGRLYLINSGKPQATVCATVNG